MLRKPMHFFVELFVLYIETVFFSPQGHHTLRISCLRPNVIVRVGANQNMLLTQMWCFLECDFGKKHCVLTPPPAPACSSGANYLFRASAGPAV